MVLSFSELGTVSWKQFLTQWRLHIGVAVIVALAMTGLTLASESLLADKTATALERMQIDQTRMQELSERAEQGDEAAMAEMMEEMQNVSAQMREQGIDGQMMAAESLGSMVGIIVVLVAISWLITTIGSIYYLIIALEKPASAVVGLRRTVSMLIPLAVLYAWMFIRSFAWIPFIGVLFAVVMTPMLMLAPVIYLKEKTGILDAARLSIQRSKGYWLKLFGNTLCMGIAMGVMLFIINMSIGIALAESLPLLFTLVAGTANQLMVAYLVTFYVQLSATVLQHPLSTATVQTATKS